MGKWLNRTGVVLGLTLLVASAVWAADSRPKKGPTVLLVTIDTIRADRLGCYGYGRRTTPVIDHLAGEARLCREAVASVPLTTPSHASIFTGLHPRSHAVLGNSWQLGASFRTLAEQFRDAGYRTGAFVSAVVLDPRCGLNRGFEHYSAVARPKPETVLSTGRSRERPGDEDEAEAARRRFSGRQRRGDETVDDALAWMEAQRGDAPLFVWVHLYDPHQPYDPPEPYRQLFGPERGERNLSTILRPSFEEFDHRHPDERFRDSAERDPARPPSSRARGPGLTAASLTANERKRIDELYDGEVALADFQVGRLLAWLKGRGLYGDSVVVVMGDHGETLGEHHDYYGHHHLLFDASLRIPLVFRMPDGAGQVLPAAATTFDVAPTLLRAAGLVSPAGLDGRDLLSRPVARPVYCESYLGIRPGLDEFEHRSLSGETGRRPHLPGRNMRIHLHAVRDGRWKLLFGGGSDESPMLFDLEADPGETADVADSHQALVKALSAHWHQWCEAHGLPKRNRGHRPGSAVDQEMREKLRQLGYVE